MSYVVHRHHNLDGPSQNDPQEPMPDPTPAEIAREAEAEASVFTQAANIDKLLNTLKTFDIQKDNLADSEEIQVFTFLELKRDDTKVSLGIVSV
jgi:hypothetical protein